MCAILFNYFRYMKARNIRDLKQAYLDEEDRDKKRVVRNIMNDTIHCIIVFDGIY